MFALQIESLNKTYKNGVVALQDICFSVAKGDFFALLGPNGAGKSTTIGIITSLVNKSSGRIRVFNHDIDTHPSEAKQCIGVVPQEFNFNIFEKVEQILINQAGYYGIPYRIAKKRTEHYLKRLGLWNKRHSNARDLSGGMKRRLMIARALIHEPKLLILDEPTAGVDIELRRSLWDFVREINEKGTTIILTTHYLEEAESLCRNIAIINHGKIIEHTEKHTLLNKLKKEHFILYLRDPLHHTPILPGFNITLLDQNTLDVEIDVTQNINDLFQKLSEHTILVKSMRNKTNRLEELFLKLTNSS
ncbi:MAG: ABC transporter ATP-binding protein [Gammaproteobacteria bacterium]|nr:ABC transporter ATP-binding protein [Gammaproteobacteria bacterium]